MVQKESELDLRTLNGPGTGLFSGQYVSEALYKFRVDNDELTELCDKWHCSLHKPVLSWPMLVSCNLDKFSRS